MMIVPDGNGRDGAQGAQGDDYIFQTAAPQPQLGATA